ncbi:pYEATS domain-containing protein [Streptomyces umbrinus]|uniref:pYEATS domain-containing protein n=1 Tax=Streptomyces umbrinus TaxID=67370 RepID=UPI0033D69F76
MPSSARPRDNERLTLWTRRIALPVTVAVALLAVVAVFAAPTARAKLLVDLVTGLAWPLVLLVAVVAFWPQIQEVVPELVLRIQRGAEVQMMGLSVGSLPEQADRLPSPGAMQPVRLENVALLHTSFFSPDGTRMMGDDRRYYQFEVIVMARDDVMERIDSVTYLLPEEWPEEHRETTVRERRTRFKHKELANGTTIVTARVNLRDGDQPLVLNRFIDLREDGPRI